MSEKEVCRCMPYSFGSSFTDRAKLAVIRVVIRSTFEIDTLEVVESALNSHLIWYPMSEMSRAKPLSIPAKSTLDSHEPLHRNESTAAKGGGYLPYEKLRAYHVIVKVCSSRLLP